MYPTNPGGLAVKDLPASVGGIRDSGSSLCQRDPLEAWQPTPVLLPGESPGETSLAGYGP